MTGEKTFYDFVKYRALYFSPPASLEAQRSQRDKFPPFLLRPACPRPPRLQPRNAGRVAGRGQKRERPHASRRLFGLALPCPKGMSIFLCRPLSGKEKIQSSLRALRLCGEIHALYGFEAQLR